MIANRQVVLLKRPDGVPAITDFELRTARVPDLEQGQFLLQNHYFSMEPAIRGWLDDHGNYFEPVAIGDAVRAPSLGRVVASRHPDYNPGDWVRSLCRWEEYSIVSDATLLLDRLTPRAELPLSYYVGPLWGSGMSAYIGLHEIGDIRAGDTVVISAAAGAVGSVAGQIARLRGCHVVGLVGSDEKARITTDLLGYDQVINYKTCGDLTTAVQAACPQNVDVYFDSVGGATLNSMLMAMKDQGRIVACGMISGYNRQQTPPPVYNLWEIVSRQLTMKGFLLPSYTSVTPKAMRDLETWIAAGDIRVIENKRVGIENTVELFCDLMKGDTAGKSILELSLSAGD